MKILLIHPHEVFSKEEPWTTRILSIAEALVGIGHEVRLVHFPLKDSEPKNYAHKQLEIIPLSRRLGLGIFFKNIIRLCHLARWSDIVHFQKCYYYASIPVLIASLLTNRPVHYDWDDWEMKIYFYPKRQSRLTGIFLGVLEFFIPYLADTVSVSSERLRRLCIERGIIKDRIFKVSVGADLVRFNPEVSGDFIRSKYDIKDPLVIYVGQLHGAQYAELFIKAANEILKSNTCVSFMIVGGGYRLPFLKDLAATMGLKKKLIFTGAVRYDEVPFYIASADVTVACFEENDITRCKSPLKIAEYMACGKAIVASNVGEIRNMVGGAGLLTRPGDIFSLSEGINRLLVDSQLRKRLGLLSRKRAEEKYNWNRIALNLLRAYNMALHLENKSRYEVLIPVGDFVNSNYEPLLQNMDFPISEIKYFLEFETFIRYHGLYEVFIKYASASKRSCEVHIDNRLLNYLCLEEITADSEDFKWSRIRRIDIAPGFHTLRIIFHNLPSNISHVKFVKV